MPSYETSGAAGMDVRANIIDPICVAPGERVLMPTGLYLEVPAGLECQVRPRSGLAAKHGLTVLNSPGTVDADYRGEIGVILVNLSNTDFKIENGERIAQLVIAKHERMRPSHKGRRYFSFCSGVPQCNSVCWLPSSGA